ncbi:phage tail protein [Pararhizobium haloflavum]|uniref:phage tail protein n=1 Tax=Pararhizobium haloflavum TaxID=2037914 RepID=UPI000C19E5D8|nr:phage tail protein [Pararhizobium haloflavum]
MLYRLGSLAIKVHPFNVHQVGREAAADYAFKPVIGAEAPGEFVGEGANTWSFEGQLLPRKIGGLDELEILDQMRSSGLPQYLIRGDGRPMGWVVIESVSEQSTYLDPQGVGQVITVSIRVRRAPKPSPGSYFSIVSGFFR